MGSESRVAPTPEEAGSIADLRERLSETESLLKLSKESLESARKAAKKASERVGTRDTELKQLRKEFESLQAAAVAKDAELQRVKHASNESESRFKEREAELSSQIGKREAELSSQFKQREAELMSQFEQRVAELLSKHSQSAMGKELADLRTQLKAAQEGEAAALDAVSKACNQLSTSNAEKVALQQGVVELKTRSALSVSAEADALAKVSASAETVRLTGSVLTELAQQLETIQVQVEQQVRSRNTGLEVRSALSEATKRSAAAKAKVKTLESRLTDLESTLQQGWRAGTAAHEGTTHVFQLLSKDIDSSKAMLKDLLQVEQDLGNKEDAAIDAAGDADAGRLSAKGADTMHLTGMPTAAKLDGAQVDAMRRQLRLLQAGKEAADREAAEAKAMSATAAQQVEALRKEMGVMRLSMTPLPEEAASAAEAAARESLQEILNDSASRLRQRDGNLGAADFWTLTGWLDSLDLGRVIANALLTRIRAESDDTRLEREFMARLGRTGSVQTVLALLRDAMTSERLADAIWEGSQILRKQLASRQSIEDAEMVPPELLLSASGKGGDSVDELRRKFKDSGAFELAFGGPQSYWSGLAALVG